MPGCGVLAQSKGEADGYHRGLFSIVRLYVRAVQNVMAPIVGFHDGCSDDAAERDKKKRFDYDHLFNPFRRTIHTGSTGQ
jgi:hypothetical protein